jgi:hypothetical protein
MNYWAILSRLQIVFEKYLFRFSDGLIILVKDFHSFLVSFQQITAATALLSLYSDQT